MPAEQRFDKAARAGNSAKGLVHYTSRLQKARRRGNARKIAKFERKVQKYNNSLAQRLRKKLLLARLRACQGVDGTE